MSTLSPLAAPSARAQDRPLGAFDGQSGAGSAQYDAPTQGYTLSAPPAGGSLLVWKKLRGDFIVRANLGLAGSRSRGAQELGWRVSAGLGGDAPFASCTVGADGATSTRIRVTPGGAVDQQPLPGRAGVIQIERRGGAYFVSAAAEGEPFHSVALPAPALGDEVYVGLQLSQDAGTDPGPASAWNVRFVRPAKPGFVPYHDYIGSTLELLTVATGRLEMVYQAAQPFEAPNWTRDGSALIFNLSGRSGEHGHMRRFDLATRQPAPFDTGFANRNNNDHVLSFDGATLGISHHSPDHAGASIIYTVPVVGGTPSQVTSTGPSYLHGWSPDGKSLVYTGGRNGRYEIYRIGIGGGPETRLTDAEGLNDGPEFTPDGATIYFNSSRTGRMQIWRMRPDGSGQEQVTHDGFNNWFPHVSPDGKWIALLSFMGDVAPEDHPYYKQIYLRVMPAEGGPLRVVAYVYGGQGTMNVPSWSPDSTRLAFVSNTDLD